MSEIEERLPAEASADTEREDNEPTDDGSMSLIKHLEELRYRIIRSLLAVFVGSAVSYYFIDIIMKYLTLPVGKLYYLQPSEAFFTYLKVAVAAGFLLALPVVFYHVWRFFLPALTTGERKVIAILVPISVLLFFIGLAFSFFFVLPAAVKFFMGFGGEDLQAMFSVDRYFDFVLTFVLPFGFVFELPLVITILGKMGIIGSAFLAKHQRTVIFLSFVIAAIITPTPDVFTQSMLALPMILLYEVGFLIVKYVMRK
ncbi:MAG: twin-arginine translocase subunit TatC [Selenomonadaceae bacterium]|nr:twin-arginine translocase subunit TatC [Selenomonadaceae bacterium]